MTAVDDLATWLTQIWDEEQRAAEECAEVYPPPWELSDRGHTARIRADEPNFWVVAELEQHPTVDGWVGDRLEHIARHDPAAVLARIAADRQILALHEPTGAQLGHHHPVTACSVCGHPDSGVVTVYPCQTVRLLALPHAGRPGYQEAWRPA